MKVNDLIELLRQARPDDEIDVEFKEKNKIYFYFKPKYVWYYYGIDPICKYCDKIIVDLRKK